MQQEVKEAALEIIKTLQESGFRAYFVGGAVRDQLLNRPSSDIDITTSAKPDDICFLFPRAHRMHTEHETVLVRIKGMSIEVTTEKGSSLAEDLDKRDFTMNAIAQTMTGEYIDPHNGQADLQSRLIRSSNPHERLVDDPLRMLRAIRFVSELDFTIEQSLLQEITLRADMIRSVAAERSIAEWEKLLSGKALPQAILYLEETSLYQHIPGVSLTAAEMNRLRYLPAFDQKEDSVFLWYMYLVWIGRTNDASLSGLLLSNDRKRKIKQRLHLYAYRLENELTDWQLYQFGLSAVVDVERSRNVLSYQYVKQEDIMYQWDDLPIQSREQLPISGHDLMLASGKSAGPWIKEDLEALEKKIINRDIQPNKNESLRWLERKWNNER